MVHTYAVSKLSGLMKTKNNIRVVELEAASDASTHTHTYIHTFAHIFLFSNVSSDVTLVTFTLDLASLCCIELDLFSLTASFDNSF